MKRSINDRPDSAARQKYWNEDYVSYWRARVDEANKSNTQTSDMVAGDSKTTSDELYADAIGLLNISKKDNVLELACGFGRSLSWLCRAAHHVAAVDISEQMIEAAAEACREENVSFHVSPSEELPFADGAFDVVVCFAAFDAMYQAEALIEMSRVSAAGARILLTGKNTDYFDDDHAALEAEAGARAKGHPNYFTDAAKLIRQIGDFGFDASLQRYYRRRGDFANQTFDEIMPHQYYEYLLVLTKVGECRATPELAISDAVSRAFARRSPRT